MSKPGRNEPCYCGSGEKYKNCHMAADKAAEQEQRAMVEAGRWLRQDLIKYAREERFAEVFATGLPLYWKDYYTIDNAEEMSESEAMRFFDWLVFDYQYGDLPRLILAYHEDKYAELSDAQQKVLDRWLDAPPATAYELVDYDGQLLQVREFNTQETVEIYEPAGHGPVEPGDLLLGRLIPVLDRLEFSTVAAYLPQSEIADLAAKLQAAREADQAEFAGGSYEEFMRRRGYLIIHHALDQAVEQGRPPVAALDPSQAGRVSRKAIKQLRKLPRFRG